MHREELNKYLNNLEFYRASNAFFAKYSDALCKKVLINTVTYWVNEKDPEENIHLHFHSFLVISLHNVIRNLKVISLSIRQTS
jgi:hypothetical protein